MTVFAPGFTFEDYPDGRNALSTEQQISAFEDSYKVWLLNIAKQTRQIPDSGFAVLAILNPYFEMIARHHKGYTALEAKRRTGQLFTEGFKLVFSDTTFAKFADQVAEILYEALRCGVAHIGLTGNRIHLSETLFPQPLTLLIDQNGDVSQVSINPTMWVDTIEQHFNHYISLLRNPNETELRAAFSKCFTSSF